MKNEEWLTPLEFLLLILTYISRTWLTLWRFAILLCIMLYSILQFAKVIIISEKGEFLTYFLLFALIIP